MNIIFIFREARFHFGVNRPWWPFFALALWATACVDPTSHRDVADAAARRVLFKNLAERVIAPTYADFARSTMRLSKAAEAYATSLSADDLKDARAAFVDAMLTWERAEVFQVGPTAPVSGAVVGGKGLRQQIYAWDKVNRCAISRALVEQAYATDKAFADLYPEARGLGALELMLFDASTVSGCAKTNTILTSGDWVKLTAEDHVKRRALYAKRAAADLVLRAATLQKAWQQFTPELATAGDGSALFAGTQDALNAITGALFYVDTEVKDMKLARPLGITESCGGTSCVAQVEHPYAKISRPSIQANLEALRDLFHGNPPEKRGAAMWGLKDLLLSISADDLANDMSDGIEGSLNVIAAINSLEEAIEADDPSLMLAYDKLKALTNLLKTKFVAVLSLQAPMTAASDND